MDVAPFELGMLPQFLRNALVGAGPELCFLTPVNITDKLTSSSDKRDHSCNALGSVPCPEYFQGKLYHPDASQKMLQLSPGKGHIRCKVPSLNCADGNQSFTFMASERHVCQRSFHHSTAHCLKPYVFGSSSHLHCVAVHM